MGLLGALRPLMGAVHAKASRLLSQLRAEHHTELRRARNRQQVLFGHV